MLELKQVCKRFAARVVADDLSLTLAPGEMLALLGPSGCGKSTLLNMIAGLETPDSGQMMFAGEDLAAIAPEARHFALMFQDYALFPHLSVKDNVLFGLVERRVERAQAEQRAMDALEALGLAGYARRSIGALSGGEAQRVALARALVTEPRLLLLDEPFSSLDAHLRQGLQSEFRRHLKARGISAIWVTHDRQEAFAMADRLLLLHQGRVQQLASPARLLAAPANAWVASFIGFDNVTEQGVVPDAAFILHPAQAPALVEQVMFMAESVRLSVSQRGQRYKLHLSLREAQQLAGQLYPGAEIGLGLDRSQLISFPEDRS
jgi:ABC-type Fe3+/spermidine/putrescine transport system ATPase subunit